MDQLSLQRIETGHPVLKELMKKAYIEANNKLGKGVRLRFAWVYRSPKEQRKMFLQKPKITNADEWMSFHQYGLAFDIVLMYDNNGDGIFEEASWNTKRDGDNDGMADWLEVTLVFEKYGFKNGFLKNGKKWDLPHFQKTFGYTVRQLRKMILDGNIIVSNGITYPNIKI